MSMIAFFALAYVPSISERAWYGDATGKICRIASSYEQVRDVTKALQGDEGYMSRMEDGSLIEPLTGIGRHPFANVGCAMTKRVGLFDTSYLTISDFCNSSRPNRSYFFDIGCSMYDEEKTYAAGLSSTIPFFEGMYAKTCVAFDRVVAWEAKPYPNWWDKVPPSKRDHITFYNQKVTAGKLERHLARVSASDFVVIKLDIDHTNTEMEILRVVEQNANLVDELFFEYHYYFDGLNFGWGVNKHLKTEHNVSSAIQVMKRLRTKGVRAHFWI